MAARPTAGDAIGAASCIGAKVLAQKRRGGDFIETLIGAIQFDSAAAAHKAIAFITPLTCHLDGVATSFQLGAGFDQQIAVDVKCAVEGDLW